MFAVDSTAVAVLAVAGTDQLIWQTHTHTEYTAGSLLDVVACFIP